jgi:anti-sigma factor RsiW
LRPEVESEVAGHLAGCAGCAREEAIEHALTGVLDRLPQRAAPLALKRRLAAQWPAPVPARRGRWLRRLVPALAVAAALLVALPVSYQLGQSARPAAMVAEAVNDHLRLLASQHPLDIESSNFHQVKPWFEGRLDFAPLVGFLGDDQFPLKGGAVGYFLDRKAAVFVYQRRLHVISLFVFRGDGLPWPSRGLKSLAGLRGSETVSRGFSVLLWRSGELGYALVSDVDPAELGRLALKIAGTGPPAS